MQILTITADHPPYHSGGYELRIKEIMDGLALRGHKVHVLTTVRNQRSNKGSEESSYPVRRILSNRYNAKWFPKELLQDLIDTKTLEKEIGEIQPDLIYLGHTYPLTKQLLPYLASLQVPIFYDEGGNGLKGAWTDHGRWFEFAGDYRIRFRFLNLIKPTVVRLVLWMSRGRIKNMWSFPERMIMFFNSELNRNNAKFFGVPVENDQVIHSGVDIEKFAFVLKQKLSNPIIIIIPGRIELKKGQLDGVKLIQELSSCGIEAELLLVGPSSLDGYLDVLENEIDKLNLTDKVHFIRMVDQDQMVELYHKADMCLFSSYHHSGFSRVPLEAMACGCAVLSYGNEGSDEVITDHCNGFITETGGIHDLVEVIKKVVENPRLLENVCVNARNNIEINYSLSRYIDQLEHELYSSISAKFRSC